MTVTGNDSVNINTPLWIENGILSGNPLSYFGGSGATIADTSGTLNLSQFQNTFVYHGQDLTFLSTGDITDGGNSVTIDTTGINASGNVGGNVYFFAGFDFAPPPSFQGQPDPTAQFNIPSTLTDSGSISLSHTTINTSANVQSGSVYIYANGGSITLGAINTATPVITGVSGNVTVIGSGITTSGVIMTASSALTGIPSGAVTLISAAPMLGGPLYVTAGHVGGSPIAAGAAAGGVFIGNVINAGSALVTIAANDLAGNITTSGSLITSGTLTLAAGGNIGGVQKIDGTRLCLE